MNQRWIRLLPFWRTDILTSLPIALKMPVGPHQIAFSDRSFQGTDGWKQFIFVFVDPREGGQEGQNSI